MNAPFLATAGNGVVIGLVVGLDDPHALNRVQIRLPHLGGEVALWARLVSPMAGDGRGLVARPEVGDEVLVLYEQGDPRRAYVIGGLWSAADRPPDNGPQPSDNHWRFLRSRSGHIVKLDDTPGGERIEIVDKTGKCRLVIDAAGDAISLVADTGSITIESRGGGVTVNAPAGEVAVKANSATVEATSEIALQAPAIKLSASAELSIEAGGALTLKGATIALN